MPLIWMDAALCRHFPTLPWIAEPADRGEASAAAMTVVCQCCPVSEACREYVDHLGIVSGFWAGRDRTPATDVRDVDGAA